MNQFLTSLLNAAAIDIGHLRCTYLNSSELNYLNNALKSEQDLKNDFYTSDHGDNLECLLQFLTYHKNIIVEIMGGKGQGKMLIELYTSSILSGGYDCFRFDLSKFPQTYIPHSQVITLYRIGRETECEGSLGCSWSKSVEGLGAYCSASGITKAMLELRPIFIITIDDKQVLFLGNQIEDEYVLKRRFKHYTLSLANDELRARLVS